MPFSRPARLPMALAAAALLSPLAVLDAAAKGCVAFDTSWNLYAFGGSSDVNLGQNSTWSSPSAKTLSTNGRPSWTGNNTLCLLSQYNNALVVLNADSSSSSDVYIYDFAGDSWSTQTTSSAPSNLALASAILDHDTNVIYALPGGDSQSLYSLDLSSVTKSANSTAIPWLQQNSPGFSSYNQPTMAEASNHILFFGAPSVAAGSAPIYVIHYAYEQPDAQSFSTVNGASSNFPDSTGLTTGIPYASNQAGDQVVFVPSDFSATYVVTHWTSPSTAGQTSDAPAGINTYINTTQTLPAPSSKDTSSSFASSDTSLVQLDGSGALYYLEGAYGNGWQVSSSASWQKMSYTLAGLSGGSSGSSSSSASSGASSSSSAATGSQASMTSGSMTGSGSSTASAAGSSSTNSKSAAVAGVSAQVGFAMMCVTVAAGLGALAL